jgi:1-phosphofructokinase family hexose kinase
MDYAVLSGSTPPGVPDSIYRELIEIAKHYGVPSVLDTSGRTLVEGLAAVPLMTKPNVHELSAAVGRPLSTVEEAADAAREINATGVEIVAVTLGRDGALVSTSDSIYRAKPPEIPFVSAVGSGDAFVAAFVYTRVGGGSIADSLRLATAAGAANAMTFGAGFCSREDILRLANEVEVVPL